MASFYQDVSEKVDNTMINIKDFARHHRHVIKGNEKRYVYEVMKLNNERYELFEKIIKRHSQDGMILCKKAAFLWIVFEDSREVLNYYKHRDILRQTDPERAKWWIKEFMDKSIQELYDLGPNVVSSAYGLIIDYFREWMTEQKYERIYSQTSKLEPGSEDEFDKWLELAETNKELIEGKEIPFDIQTISEKAKTIISVRN